MYRGAGFVQQKPENVLKRVNELIKSGNNSDKSKALALEQLNNIFTQKKRTFQKIYETIMKRHLELCVDLKDFRTAKDGLHQYRNMTQLVDPQSLEAVAMHLIEMSELKATEARMKSDKVALAAAATISDLDQEETPESIMLTSMTYEGSRNRANRETVVPWLKFLWETYRTVLELLYKNQRLEKVYHKTCEKTFKFCLEYQRFNEFRRLCEMLRAHFTQLQRATGQSLRANKPAWEWTSEGIELHLQTRFVQLEVATSLDLWNEGFRTVEDIYEIMQLNKKSPKPKLMVAYYEKLTRIFWVSENYLFHAYAWYRYYCLCVECRKDMKPEERATQAASVLLAAMCIPTFRETDAVTFEEDEITAEKNAQMALLLDFQANPTRQALLGEIVSRGVLGEVAPELAALYHAMETGFHPLSLIKDLAAPLALIKSDPLLAAYSLPLQRVAVLRTVMQLSRVFSTLRISSLKDLVAHLDMSYCEVEKLLVDSAASKQIQMRIDHCSGCIRFGASSVTTSAAVETQLTVIGASLNKVSESISAALTVAKAEHDALARKEYIDKVAATLEESYSELLERKNYIERRKEGLERLQQEKQRLEEKLKEADEAKRREEESQRLRKEEEQRKLAKERKIKDQIDVMRTKKALETHGKVIDEAVLNDLDEASRRALVKEAQSDAQKAKEDDARRLHEQHKRLDYITRALRLEAAELIANKYAQDVEVDRKEFEEKQVQARVQQQQDHEVALQEKARLAKTQPMRAAFESSIVAQQKLVFDAKVKMEYERAVNEHRQRKVARARQLLEDELERLEAEAEAERERQEKEEEARRIAEEKEERARVKAAAEEEKRARDADLERRRQENLANLARQKKEVEEADAARRKAAEEEGWARKQTAGAPDSRDREEPAKEVWRGGGTRAPVVAQAAQGDSQWRGGARGDARGAEPRGEGGWSRGAASTADRPEEGAAPKPLSGLDRLAALGAGGDGKKPQDTPNSKWGGSRGNDSSREDGSRWRR